MGFPRPAVDDARTGVLGRKLQRYKANKARHERPKTQFAHTLHNRLSYLEAILLRSLGTAAFGGKESALPQTGRHVADRRRPCEHLLTRVSILLEQVVRRLLLADSHEHGVVALERHKVELPLPLRKRPVRRRIVGGNVVAVDTVRGRRLLVDRGSWQGNVVAEVDVGALP